MTMIQYLNAFRTFGADVLLLALGVTLATSLFKKTVFKNCSKKLFVFLPFAIGLVVYTAYRALATWSIAPFTDELFQTCEGGFACGCAATLYYVVYEQFFRTHKTVKEPSASSPLSPLAPLLQGYVAENFAEAAANKLLSGSVGLSGDELLRFISETLAEYALPEVSQTELTTLSRLVTEFLLKLPR